MMNQKGMAVFCAAAIMLNLTGCGEKEKSEDSENRETVTQSYAEFVPNGTYSDGIFNQMKRDIKIGDREFALPCKLTDLGEDFAFFKTLEGEVLVVELEEYGTANITLCYRDEMVATLTYCCSEEENHDYSNDLIYGITLGEQFWTLADEYYNFSVGGIEIGRSTEQQVLQKLGEPKKWEYADKGAKTMRYDGENFYVEINPVGFVQSVVINFL